MSEIKTLSEVNIREGLFIRSSARDGKPKLLGSRCRETGDIFYPREAMSPSVRKPGTLEDIELEGVGRIIAFTIVRRALPGFNSPYALALIQLSDGVTTFSQLENWSVDNLKVGAEVTLTIGTINTREDGVKVIGPKFRIND